ncbi:hypothetical protein BDAP_001901 [Binucleata daphniae]
MNIENEIENILQAYNKQSANYQFSYIFYNLSQTRINTNMPIDLWNDAIQKAPSQYHTPVLLLGFDELEDRIKKQNETLKNINESEIVLKKRVNELNYKMKAIKTKVNDLCKKTRKCLRVNGESEKIEEMKEKIWKIKGAMTKKCGTIKYDKEGVEEVLWIFKQIGEELKNEVDKELG